MIRGYPYGGNRKISKKSKRFQLPSVFFARSYLGVVEGNLGRRDSDAGTGGTGALWGSTGRISPLSWESDRERRHLGRRQGSHAWEFLISVEGERWH